MPKDYYAEEIENKTPAKDYYAEEVEKQQFNIPAVFKNIFKSYTEPTNILTGIAGYKSARALGEEISKVGVPAMRQVPILKNIPFGARLTGDPNAIFDLLAMTSGAGRQAIGETTRATLPRSIKNVIRPVPFAERIRNQFFQVKQTAVNKFGQQLDELAQANPTRTISLRNTVDDIVTNLDDLPLEVKSTFRRTPKFNKMLDNPELANEVSLKDTQDIINYVQTKIPSNIKSKHIDILDTLNDIRASQLDAFPEMAGVRADYTKIIEPFKQIKNQFKFNKLLKAIQTDFGGPEGINAVKQLLPKNVIKEMGGYKNIANSLKLLKYIGQRVGAGIAIGGGIKVAQNILE